MAQKIKLLVLFALVILVSSTSFSACENDVDETIPVKDEISFKSLSVEDNKVFAKVANDALYFSFLDEIKISGNANYIVSKNASGTDEIATKTIDLEIGDNVVYIIETINGVPSKIYNVTIRRKPIYTVDFNTGEGTPIDSITVEEDSVIVAPISKLDGYILDWDYDFSVPITSSMTINAIWTLKSEAAYTVEYYLQNLENNDYARLDSETVQLTGSTNTLVTAEIKDFDHFTYNPNKGMLSNYVNADDSLILKVYYDRNCYNVSSSLGNYDCIIGGGSFKYGSTITVSATPKAGYEFLGWVSGDARLSSDFSYTFTIDKDVEAKFEVYEELKNFIFNSTDTTFEITGIKDKNVKEIYVPSYITKIRAGAFSGCSSLECIELPFIGETYQTENSFSYPLGFIFGTTNYENSIKTYQTFIGPSGEEERLAYYIPKSLKKVVINSDIIPFGSFNNCTELTSIILGENTKTIERFQNLTDAFENCNPKIFNIYNNARYLGTAENPFLFLIEIIDKNAKEIELHPNTVTITACSFDGCSLLESITINEKVKYIEASFMECENLSRVNISNLAKWCEIEFESTSTNPLKFARNLYLNNELITHLEIPESVTRVNDFAFYGCWSITSITIPDSIEQIGAMAFLNTQVKYNMYNDSRYLGNDDNPYLVFISGTLTSNSEYILHQDTKIIADLAFCYSTYIDPTVVTLPSGLESIGNQAFWDCTQLTTIYFCGTEAEWDLVRKGENWDKYQQFSDSEITKLDYTLTFNSK